MHCLPQPGPTLAQSRRQAWSPLPPPHARSHQPLSTPHFLLWFGLALSGLVWCPRCGVALCNPSIHPLRRHFQLPYRLLFREGRTGVLTRHSSSPRIISSTLPTVLSLAVCRAPSQPTPVAPPRLDSILVVASPNSSSFQRPACQSARCCKPIRTQRSLSRCRSVPPLHPSFIAAAQSNKTTATRRTRREQQPWPT